jgi:hypothetical protein
MAVERLNAWKSFCVVASVMWIAAVAFFAIWHEGMETDRLRFWADSVEWTINADPLVRMNAAELRYKLGDEQFIAAAADSYPDVDLRDTLRRYEVERASHPRYEHPAIAFVLWALVPPALLYALGLIFVSLRTALRRSAKA